MSEKPLLTYIRAEGTLFSRGALSLAAYLSANGQSFTERAVRLGQLALSSPVLGLMGQTDKAMANRATYVPLRNMSEDRIRSLTAEYSDEILVHQVRHEGVRLIQREQKAGRKVILLSDQLESVVRPVLKTLRLKDLEVVCNQLEFKNGRATGALIKPVIGGHTLALWIQNHARENTTELASASAYASQAPDLLFLAAVGKPHAVNPDPTLRRSATEANWPILNLR